MLDIPSDHQPGAREVPGSAKVYSFIDFKESCLWAIFLRGLGVCFFFLGRDHIHLLFMDYYQSNKKLICPKILICHFCEYLTFCCGTFKIFGRSIFCLMNNPWIAYMNKNHSAVTILTGLPGFLSTKSCLSIHQECNVPSRSPEHPCDESSRWDREGWRWWFGATISSKS